MGYTKDILCILILGMCSDVDPLDKVDTNAFTHKIMYHRLRVSPAAIFVSL